MTAIFLVRIVRITATVILIRRAALWIMAKVILRIMGGLITGIYILMIHRLSSKLRLRYFCSLVQHPKLP